MKRDPSANNLPHHPSHLPFFEPPDQRWRPQVPDGWGDNFYLSDASGASPTHFAVENFRSGPNCVRLPPPRLALPWVGAGRQTPGCYLGDTPASVGRATMERTWEGGGGGGMWTQLAVAQIYTIIYRRCFSGGRKQQQKKQEKVFFSPNWKRLENTKKPGKFWKR